MGASWLRRFGAAARDADRTPPQGHEFARQKRGISFCCFGVSPNGGGRRTIDAPAVAPSGWPPGLGWVCFAKSEHAESPRGDIGRGSRAPLACFAERESARSGSGPDSAETVVRVPGRLALFRQFGTFGRPPAPWRAGRHRYLGVLVGFVSPLRLFGPFTRGGFVPPASPTVAIETACRRQQHYPIGLLCSLLPITSSCICRRGVPASDPAGASRCGQPA
jgi:hypothetical protein